jgi:hypothetical protein
VGLPVDLQSSEQTIDRPPIAHVESVADQDSPFERAIDPMTAAMDPVSARDSRSPMEIDARSRIIEEARQPEVDVISLVDDRLGAQPQGPDRGTAEVQEHRSGVKLRVIRMGPDDLGIDAKTQASP